MRSACDYDYQCGARYGGHDGCVTMRPCVCARGSRVALFIETLEKVETWHESRRFRQLAVDFPRRHFWLVKTDEKAQASVPHAQLSAAMERVKTSGPTLGAGALKACSKGSKASKASTTTQAKADAALLPSLKLSRKKGLSLTKVGNDAWVVRGLCDKRECGAIRDAADKNGYTHATSRGTKFGEANRNHGRAGYRDEILANRLWQDTGLKDLLETSLPPVHEGTPVGLNPALRIYRYAVDEVFGAHYDDYQVVDSGVTAFTFLLYITGEDEGEQIHGGETAFFASCVDGAKELFRVPPDQGVALIFRHGATCQPHASLPVRRGVKTVLRSDVVCRK